MEKIKFLSERNPVGPVTKLTDEQASLAFWTAYIRGVRRLYDGNNFGSKEDYEWWREAVNNYDKSR